MRMLQTMRWVGPDDAASLNDSIQAACQGVVTSRHQHAAGVVCSFEDIRERLLIIEADNHHRSLLQWVAVQNVFDPQ